MLIEWSGGEGYGGDRSRVCEGCRRQFPLNLPQSNRSLITPSLCSVLPSRYDLASFLVDAGASSSKSSLSRSASSFPEPTPTASIVTDNS